MDLSIKICKAKMFIIYHLEISDPIKRDMLRSQVRACELIECYISVIACAESKMANLGHSH